MKEGQWIKIIHMEGEPHMTGEIGQYEFTDSIGQLHGTWGLGIQPDKDKYELLTESQVAEIRAEEERKRKAYEPPYINGAKRVEVLFDAVPIVSRVCWVDGKKPTRPVKCKVVLDLNGCYESAKKEGHRRACVVGVPDNMSLRMIDKIRAVAGQDCCPLCSVEPCDLRKPEEDYIPAIVKAVNIALGKEEA